MFGWYCAHGLTTAGASFELKDIGCFKASHVNNSLRIIARYVPQKPERLRTMVRAVPPAQVTGENVVVDPSRLRSHLLLISG